MYLGRQFGACRVVGGPDEPARARHICEIWDVCLRAVSATRRSWLHAKTLCMFLSCFALSKRFTFTCIIPICAVTPLKISFTPPSGARSPALPPHPDPDIRMVRRPHRSHECTFTHNNASIAHHTCNRGHRITQPNEQANRHRRPPARRTPAHTTCTTHPHAKMSTPTKCTKARLSPDDNRLTRAS
jgi:hypothetical protein